MGQRHRTAVANLTTEKRNDRARRSEDVAKAHHGEFGAPALRREGLQGHLREALAGPHDVGRAHSLVGTDQDEVADPVVARRLRRDKGAKNVVAHPFARVVFNQRHMLVGRRVIDRLRPPGRHDLVHALGIAHRSEQRYEARGLARQESLEFLMDAIEREFALFDEQQCHRLQQRELATQLAADRPTSPGHQNHSTSHVLSEQDVIRRNWLAPKQVIDVKFADIRSAYFSLSEFKQARQGTNGYLERPHSFNDLVALTPRSRRQCQQHVADPL